MGMCDKCFNFFATDDSYITHECKTKEETKMTKKTDELKQSKEDLKIGFDWEPKKKLPSKPYKQLVSYDWCSTGEIIWGVFSHMDGDKVYAHWSNSYPCRKSHYTEFMELDRILDIVDIIVHEPKKLVPTKPYKQLVSYYSSIINRKKWGVFSHMEGNSVWAYWEGWSSEKVSLGTTDIMYIEDVVDVVVHEPKEENLSAAQELSVQQESANFAHAAVQGIINAHAEKNGETNEDLEAEIIMSPTELSKLKRTEFAKGYDKATKMYLEGFTFSDFDLSVSRTWKKQDFKDAVSNAALGLTGEAGEVADLIKKGVYHGRGFNLEDRDMYTVYPDGLIFKEDVKDELSDVLFYVSAMAQEFGFTLEDVAHHNREKLEKRCPEGFSTEASAQKVDRTPEVNPVEPKGTIKITKKYWGSEDHVEILLEGRREWHTFFKTSKEVDKKIKNLNEGESLSIEDEHHCVIKFSRKNGLVSIHSIEHKRDGTKEEDFKGEGFTLEVTPKEVTD